MVDDADSAGRRDASAKTARRRLLRLGTSGGATLAAGLLLARPAGAQAAPGPLLDKGGEFYDVKAYGAAGNGSTIDSAAIQAAIAACINDGGGTVLFPRGNYMINAPVVVDSDSVVLAGVGGEFASQITVATGSDPSYAVIVGSTHATNYCGIRDLTVKGNPGGSGSGIGFHCNDGDMRGVRVLQFGGDGIDVGNYTNAGTIFDVHMDDVYIRQIGRDGLHVAPSVFNSEFVAVKVAGANDLASSQSRFGIYCQGTDCKFIACHAYFNRTHGFYQDTGSWLQIIGGEFESNGTAGVYLYSRSLAPTVHGFHGYDNIAFDIVLDSVDNFSVSQLQLRSSAQKNISVYGSSSGVVSMCNAQGATYASLAVEGSDHVLVLGNTVRPGSGSYALLMSNSSQIKCTCNYFYGNVAETGLTDYNSVKDGIVAGTVTLNGQHSVQNGNT